MCQYECYGLLQMSTCTISLNLSLYLVELKSRVDSVIVFGETSKNRPLVVTANDQGMYTQEDVDNLSNQIIKLSGLVRMKDDIIEELKSSLLMLEHQLALKDTDKEMLQKQDMIGKHGDMIG